MPGTCRHDIVPGAGNATSANPSTIPHASPASKSASASTLHAISASASTSTLHANAALQQLNPFGGPRSIISLTGHDPHARHIQAIQGKAARNQARALTAP